MTSTGHLTAQDAAHSGPAIPQQTMILGEDALAAVVGREDRQGKSYPALAMVAGLENALAFL